MQTLRWCHSIRQAMALWMGPSFHQIWWILSTYSRSSVLCAGGCSFPSAHGSCIHCVYRDLSAHSCASTSHTAILLFPYTAILNLWRSHLWLVTSERCPVALLVFLDSCIVVRKALHVLCLVSLWLSFFLLFFSLQQSVLAETWERGGMMNKDRHEDSTLLHTQRFYPSLSSLHSR